MKTFATKQRSAANGVKSAVPGHAPTHHGPVHEPSAAQRVRIHEIMQASPSTPIVQRQAAPKASRLRLPTLEVFSAMHGDFLAMHARALTPVEESYAAFVFQSSIDRRAVRVVTSEVVSAPTTLGNDIRIPPSYAMPPETLIHELTHVWQFQTKGTSYISDSLWHQTLAALTTGSRNAAYAVTIVPGQSIHAYTAEQQAMIVEEYFADPAVRTDPEYTRMIGEVRSGRPLSTATILGEAAFGSGSASTGRGRESFGAPDPFQGAASTIPQFRWEF